MKCASTYLALINLGKRSNGRHFVVQPMMTTSSTKLGYMYRMQWLDSRSQSSYYGSRQELSQQIKRNNTCAASTNRTNAT